MASTSWRIGEEHSCGGGLPTIDADADPLKWDPGDVSSTCGEESEEEGREEDRAAGGGEDGKEETQVAAEEFELFSVEELKAWTGRQAVLWISDAGNPFEVLGLRPEPVSCRTSLRARYRRLSLLVHPDKNSDPAAASCFQRLAEAFRVIGDEVGQLRLLQKLFPAKYGEGADEDDAQRAKDQRLSRKAARRARRSRNTLSTVDQAAAAAAAELRKRLKEKESDDAAKTRFTNRRNFEALAPSKKRRLRPEPRTKLPAGCAAAPTAFPEAAAGSGAEGVAEDDASKRVTCTDPFGRADPSTLWSTGGAAGEEALARAGWCRLESRGHPGCFYFLHRPTQRTALAGRRSPASTLEPLPPGWEVRESRRRPGTFYYVHAASGQSQKEKPAQVGPLPVPVRPLDGGEASAPGC